MYIADNVKQPPLSPQPLPLAPAVKPIQSLSRQTLSRRPSLSPPPSSRRRSPYLPPSTLSLLPPPSPSRPPRIHDSLGVLVVPTSIRMIITVKVVVVVPVVLEAAVLTNQLPLLPVRVDVQQHPSLTDHDPPRHAQ